jgi:hypothetical protein
MCVYSEGHSTVRIVFVLVFMGLVRKSPIGNTFFCRWSQEKFVRNMSVLDNIFHSTSHHYRPVRKVSSTNRLSQIDETNYQIDPVPILRLCASPNRPVPRESSPAGARQWAKAPITNGSLSTRTSVSATTTPSPPRGPVDPSPPPIPPRPVVFPPPPPMFKGSNVVAPVPHFTMRSKVEHGCARMLPPKWKPTFLKAILKFRFILFIKCVINV